MLSENFPAYMSVDNHITRFRSTRNTSTLLCPQGPSMMLNPQLAAQHPAAWQGGQWYAAMSASPHTRASGQVLFFLLYNVSLYTYELIEHSLCPRHAKEVCSTAPCHAGTNCPATWRCVQLAVVACIALCVVFVSCTHQVAVVLLFFF